ncbi:uroporphyrinogen-III synthase [Psychrobacter sp. FDAARGOS_221]|uniref:uroporphyrinogen-III synthase n=1 Tax=Psychrobacter sp. FDAARGOS_221 TaxID=1975705 RepID=UPI000BB53EA2|nr:uroporphyrinogen-III synthase [Psychrobacter sp. FDAARGOS_221]PNK60885.1 uroporphyrinogen-III synthase [Psychrobacter sp. FDAARGOS_221]
MIFVNTRPTSRATPLTQAMQAKGLTVLSMPLLELVTIDISEREQQYQQAFCQQPDKYQALVVVSPTAARQGLAACPKGFIPSPNCAVIAVGHATAEVLRQAGWQVQCPDEYSNEGMMRMPEISRLQQGNHLLVWRGRGGRRVLVNFLQDNGVNVDAIAWYQRQCPAQAAELFSQMQQQLKQLASSAKPVVLISSGEAFSNWRQLMADSTQYELEDFDYLAFGKRLTQIITDLQLPCVRLEHLDNDEVWRGVQAVNNKSD